MYQGTTTVYIRSLRHRQTQHWRVYSCIADPAIFPSLHVSQSAPTRAKPLVGQCYTRGFYSEYDSSTCLILHCHCLVACIYKYIHQLQALFKDDRNICHTNKKSDQTEMVTFSIYSWDPADPSISLSLSVRVFLTGSIKPLVINSILIRGLEIIIYSS